MEKRKKKNTVYFFEGVLRGKGASAHAEAIGNICSFAHAKYGGNPCLGRLFRDQITFRLLFATIILGLSALRAPTVGPYGSRAVVA